MAKNDRGFAIVSEMVSLYYDKHPSENYKKDDMLAYIKQRLKKCPHGDNKPFCSSCTIHCYEKSKRLEIKKIMKYSGPRMIFLRPRAFFAHLFEEIKNKNKT